MKKLLLIAYNIHTGGGKVLLLELLRAIDMPCTCLVDSRLELSDFENSSIEFIRLKPSILSRFKAELLIRKLSTKHEKIFAFGNLPPIFNTHVETYVYLQNKYILDATFLNTLPVKARLRLALERLWFKCFFRKNFIYIVQTESMKACLQKKFPAQSVEIMPFVARITNSDECQKEDCSFVYVASGEPHKNHKKLADAFALLAKNNINPKLILVLNPKSFPELIAYIKSLPINVEIIPSLSHYDVISLYKRCSALIYPSRFESFGLPLIEAQSVGLPIIASELDYVRDICSPAQTFDPNSELSIARAIERFLNIDERSSILTASEVVKKITDP